MKEAFLFQVKIDTMHIAMRRVVTCIQEVTDQKNRGSSYCNVC